MYGPNPKNHIFTSCVWFRLVEKKGNDTKSAPDKKFEKKTFIVVTPSSYWL